MTVAVKREAETAGATRLAIDLIVPRGELWRWHLELAKRLRSKGHGVVLVEGRPSAKATFTARAILWVSSRIPKLGGTLSAPVATAPAPGAHDIPDLRIELGAHADLDGTSPTLRLVVNGVPSTLAALRILAGGGLPTLETVLDGKIVGRARPMVERRTLLGRGFDDVLARAMTLVEKTVGDIAWGRPLRQLSAMHHEAPRRSLLAATVGWALPRLAGELLRSTTHHYAHWRVGYRLSDSSDVPLDGRLGGGWRELQDDGTHFYADPFPFVHQGRRFLFVEDYDHYEKKACISVVEVRCDGTATRPRPVLVEPHHLSYPNVFEQEGSIWMLPEASAGKELVLYRAAQFPDRWVRHSALIQGRELCDATLLEHEDSLYLFATERDGLGSTSDTMVVYFADHIEGPWKPHPQNPIVIDRATARPGGNFLRDGADIFLPVQDGTECYGGGLGIARLVHLDRHRVQFSAPRPLRTGEGWPYPRIHTYNSNSGLEAIDGLAEVKRRSRWLR